jgi:hypothetical protein
MNAMNGIVLRVSTCATKNKESEMTNVLDLWDEILRSANSGSCQAKIGIPLICDLLVSTSFPLALGALEMLLQTAQLKQLRHVFK